MGKITEKGLIKLLEILLDHENEITLQEFIRRVKVTFELSEYDLGVSESRPSEQRYVQRCRNIKSHNSFPPNVEYRNETFFKI